MQSEYVSSNENACFASGTFEHNPFHTNATESEFLLCLTNPRYFTELNDIVTICKYVNDEKETAKKQ